MPALSIVIPVYNKQKYISDTLKSVINQTFIDSEIIIVDDGSTDNSLQICEEFAKSCNRIKIFSQNRGGVSAARNRGIAESSGKYLVVVDADDTIAYNAHEILVTTAENFGCDLVCSGYNRVSGSIRPCTYSYPKMQLLRKEYIVNNIVANSIGVKHDGSVLGEHWCILYSLLKIKENGISYDISQKKEEDKPFIMKNLFYADSMVFVNEYLYNYISRPGSLISSYSPRFENCLKNLNLYYTLFHTYFDFECKNKINYNIGILEECIQYVYVHSKDVVCVQTEIMEMLQKREVSEWFGCYSESEKYRVAVKNAIMCKNYTRAYNIYRGKYRFYKLKLFVHRVLSRIRH